MSDEAGVMFDGKIGKQRLITALHILLYHQVGSSSLCFSRGAQPSQV
jgi:hypothetical protein